MFIKAVSGLPSENYASAWKGLNWGPLFLGMESSGGPHHENVGAGKKKTFMVTSLDSNSWLGVHIYFPCGSSSLYGIHRTTVTHVRTDTLLTKGYAT